MAGFIANASRERRLFPGFRVCAAGVVFIPPLSLSLSLALGGKKSRRPSGKKGRSNSEDSAFYLGDARAGEESRPAFVAYALRTARSAAGFRTSLT